MVDRDTVIEKIKALKKHVKRLEEIGRYPVAIFVENADLQQLAAFNLQIAIQNCIDIGSHLYAEFDVGAPSNYREVFYELADKKIISKAMLEKMIQMIGLRNRIVHDYEDTSQAIMHSILKKDLKDFKLFIKQVVKFAGI